MKEITFNDGDIVTYPIHENTKNERRTIGKLSGAGIAFWIDGPEISTMVSDISKCELISKENKKSHKIFKKYSEKFDRMDIDEIGFDDYQEKAKSLFDMYVEKFSEIDT